MSAETSAAEPQQSTVLVVDDVAQNIEILGIMLREQGMKVIGALSAEQAFRVMETRLPDLILLDIQMPEMDGFTACKLLKENPTTKHIPVIFLTARTETADILKGFSLGAVDFVSKPFQAAELFARVRSHIELKHLRDAALKHNEALQQEIAERKRTEERLRQLDEEKNEFLGIVAHDLRNPLSGIILAADMIETMNGSMAAEQVTKKAANIRTAGLYMREIITNLLDINAIEAGQMLLSPAHFDIVPRLTEAIQTFHDRATEKSMTIVNELPISELVVYADPVKTIEIVENLLSNAIKYSPQHTSIYLYAEYGMMPHSSVSAVVVSVRDEGPGLTDEDKTKLFGKFARLSAQPTGGEQSTGLGLSIVKRLVEAMRGQVWCDSVYGQGAMFSIALPTKP
jgi:signal transduction histidine kinase